MSSDDHPRLRSCPKTHQGSKKSILGARVPHHARQKKPKLGPKTTPRQSKMKTSCDVPYITAFEYSLKPPEEASAEQNAVLRNPFWKMYAILSTPSVFEGCTVRFACFCNRRPLLFAPKHSKRILFHIPHRLLV